MKIIRYIIALTVIVYYIVVSLTFIAGLLPFFWLCMVSMLFLGIPYLIIGGLVEAIFGKNYLEYFVGWVVSIFEKYNPIDNMFDFMFRNRFVKYCDKCLEELKNDFEVVQISIKNSLSFVWRKIQKSVNHKKMQLQIDITKRENKKQIAKKEGITQKESLSQKKSNATLDILSKSKKEEDLNDISNSREKVFKRENIYEISKEKGIIKKESSSLTSPYSREIENSPKEKIEEADLNSISISEEKIFEKKISQIDLFEISKSRKRVPKKNIDWLEVNKRRIEIGEIGELIAMKFEKQRLSNWGIQKPEKYIVHASKNIGDGLGYDITSIDQDKSKIFIEVKTVSGSSSSEIIITKNELETMNELQHNYFIYIVMCSSQESAIVKRLSYDLIKRNFNLIPDRFKLKEK